MKNSDCLPDELKVLYEKWNAEINADPYMSQLTTVYEKWLNELKSSHPYLLENDRYSNPYYLYIPKEWQAAENRIMIVGEEGYGEWGCGKQSGWTKDAHAWSSDSYNDIRLYHRDLMLSQTKFKDIFLIAKTLTPYTTPKNTVILQRGLMNFIKKKNHLIRIFGNAYIRSTA